MRTQLLTGERLALPPLRRHWILLVRNLASPVLAAALSVGLVDVVARGLLPSDVRLLLTLAVGVPVGLSVIVVWLRWDGDSLTVTDQRVVLLEGVFQRTSKVIPLARVQDVSTVQTLLGRILDYGTVEIDAAGATGAECFAYVSRPMRVRDQVWALVARSARNVA
jgi:uncharacterized membrane protein YdbT with pleckstrin-like domain